MNINNNVDHFSNLPNIIIGKIASNLSGNDVLNLIQTSKNNKKTITKGNLCIIETIRPLLESIANGDKPLNKGNCLLLKQLDPITINAFPQLTRQLNRIMAGKIFDAHKNSMASDMQLTLLTSDRELILAAARKNGKKVLSNLQYTPFIKDKEIVLAAVQDQGTAIRYADRALQDYFIIALAAVQQNGLAARFLSLRLQKNPIIMEAFKKELESFKKNCETDLKHLLKKVYAELEELEAQRLGS